MKTSYGIGIIVVVAVVFGGIIFWYVNSNFNYSAANSQTATSAPAVGTTAKPVTGKSTTTTKTVTQTTTGVTSENSSPNTAAAPKISAFEPAAATVGSSITIVGSGFSLTSNSILFGVSADLHHSDGSADNLIATAASPDGRTLTFTVPTSGPSGILCDTNNRCIGVSAAAITPGNYPVVIKNANGTSGSAVFSVSSK